MAQLFKTNNTMKNLSTFEINETLDLLCGFVNSIRNDYPHLKEVVKNELKSAETKIEQLYNELEKRHI